MDEENDVIVLGTGLTECVLSGLLATSGKKVLHLDRNDYYGGESASLTTKQLFQKFKGEEVSEEKLGRSRDYCVDLIPKFLMANGKLIKMLYLTGVTRYNMEFGKIEGSFVYREYKGKPTIHKVPVTPKEMMSSGLLGFFEKFKAKKLATFIAQYDEKNPSTHQGMDLTKMTAEALFKKYGVSDETVEFCGHTCALFSNDEFLQRPAIETVVKMRLYADSLAMYGSSPYIYPLYGLGELPQVFARLCAVYGGVYMLNKPVDEVLYDDNGKFEGIKSGDEVAKAKMVVGDPSYFSNKVKKTGQVIRTICILDHPIQSIAPCTSGQIIIPQGQVGRKNDIYICCTSYNLRTVPKGKYLAIVATTVETENPEAEIQVGLDLLGPVLEKFTYILDTYEAVEDGSKDNVYVSKSYDASTHFESCSSDIVDIFERITGEKFDWNKKPPNSE